MLRSGHLPEPVEIVPIKRIGDNQLVTQLSMEPIERLGLVKWTFGLRTLSMIEDTLANIAANGKEVPSWTISLWTIRLLTSCSRRETRWASFSWNRGHGATFEEAHPDCFEDLVAVLALYRPGPWAVAW